MICRSAPFVIFSVLRKHWWLVLSMMYAKVILLCMKLSSLENSFNKVFSINKILRILNLKSAIEFLEKVFSTLIFLSLDAVYTAKIRIGLINPTVSWQIFLGQWTGSVSAVNLQVSYLSHRYTRVWVNSEAAQCQTMGTTLSVNSTLVMEGWISRKLFSIK